MRHCGAGCGYVWHSSEDHLHGIPQPEVVFDNAPDLYVSLTGNRVTDEK